MEWAPRSRRDRISERLAALGPDVLCLTEADAGILPSGGHRAESSPDYGDGESSRRKALLWSRWPLDEVDRVGHPALPPGRYVSALCRTPLGPLRLIAVTIPWRDAHVRTGRKDKRPWDDHLLYLHGLRPLIAGLDRSAPALVLGDFNQNVPRTRAPRHVAEALRHALCDLRVATAGVLPGIDRQVIDHVAHSTWLRASEATGFSRLDAEGRPLSDHHGVSLRLQGPCGPAPDAGSPAGPALCSPA